MPEEVTTISTSVLTLPQLTVTVPVPGAIPFTKPFSSTVMMLSSSVEYVNVASGAAEEGVTAGMIKRSEPRGTVTESALTAVISLGTGFTNCPIPSSSMKLYGSLPLTSVQPIPSLGVIAILRLAEFVPYLSKMLSGISSLTKLSSTLEPTLIPGISIPP